jgi:hypothetical protein
MFNKGFKRLFNWFRNNDGYARSRKISDYRAVSMAQKLICSGALQSTRLTGAPLARVGKW